MLEVCGHSDIEPTGATRMHNLSVPHQVWDSPAAPLRIMLLNWGVPFADVQPVIVCTMAKGDRGRQKSCSIRAESAVSGKEGQWRRCHGTFCVGTAPPPGEVISGRGRGLDSLDRQVCVAET